MSEPIDQLDHVEIRADGVGPVDTCIGIMQKPVTDPDPSVQRNIDTESQSELERSTVVLLRVTMLAEQDPSGAQIEA